MSGAAGIVTAFQTPGLREPQNLGPPVFGVCVTNHRTSGSCRPATPAEFHTDTPEPGF